MNVIKAAITAIGGYVPQSRLTNEDLSRRVETSDEWITTRTGIKERRILEDDTLGTSYMCIRAAEDLLKKSGCLPSEIDGVIVCTITPDYPVANTAAFVASSIGAEKAFAMDLVAACSGFISGLYTASSFVESGRCKKVLLIAGDKMSSIIDPEDRATCILFGDGAAAVLVEPSRNGYGIEETYLRCDGTGREYLRIDVGGSVNPPTVENVSQRRHFVRQDGRVVYKYAVTNMAKACQAVLEKCSLKNEDIDWLLPHQANLRIIESITANMGLDKEKVLVNIDRYGNTTNATIPLLLWDFEKQFKKGDKLLVTAFGGGFTWGAMLITWDCDQEVTNR